MNRRQFVGTLGAGLGLVFVPRLPRWRADDVFVERWSWAMGQPVHVMVFAGSEQEGLDACGAALAELRRVESRLTFRFKDGSLSDETFAFSQRDSFRLLSYRVIQRGPAFSHTLDAAFRQTGRYTVRFRGKADPAETVDEGRLELPPDVYNGMLGVVLKNLPRGAKGTASMVAFTPKPRLLKAELIPTEDQFFVGDIARTAVRYLVKLEIGGLLGVAASLLGKDPPPLHHWIAIGAVPAFVKFEGPFYGGGPLWRVELTSPRFPR